MNALRCLECNASYPLEDPAWRCACGGLLDLRVESRFDRGASSGSAATLERWRAAIPIARDADLVSFNEGATPLVAVDFSGREALMKLEFLLPTGSFKDRGAAVMISKAKGLGLNRVIEDSSGNAGAAVAAYCARARMQCDLFVPESAPPEKLAQIRSYGADVRTVPGSREGAAAAALKAARNAYFASHVWNPFFLHGTKTFAFEVWEQLGYRVPDTLVLPAGNGTLLLGAYLGFCELLAARETDRLPRFVAVQPAACAPIHRAFAEKLDRVEPIEPGETAATGMRVAAPRRGGQVLDVVRRTGGAVLAVEELEIAAAFVESAKKGFYIEPTSAALVAGLKRYLKEAPPGADEIVVSAFTGRAARGPH